MALFSRNEAEIFFPGARFSSARGREKSLFFPFPDKPGPETTSPDGGRFSGNGTHPIRQDGRIQKRRPPRLLRRTALLNVLGQFGDYLMNVIVKGIWYVYSLLDILIVYTTDRMIHTKGRIQMNRKPMKIRVRTPKNAQDTSR